MKEDSSALNINRTQNSKLVTALCLLCQKADRKKLVNLIDAGHENFRSSFSKRTTVMWTYLLGILRRGRSRKFIIPKTI